MIYCVLLNPFRLCFQRLPALSLEDNGCFDTCLPPSEVELLSISRGAQPLGELTVGLPGYQPTRPAWSLHIDTPLITQEKAGEGIMTETVFHRVDTDERKRIEQNTMK